jgi:hypothetical protein
MWSMSKLSHAARCRTQQPIAVVVVVHCWWNWNDQRTILLLFSIMLLQMGLSSQSIRLCMNL